MSPSAPCSWRRRFTRDRPRPAPFLAAAAGAICQGRRRHPSQLPPLRGKTLGASVCPKMLGKGKIVLRPFVQAFDRLMDASAVPVTVGLGDVRHSLAAQAHQQPHLDLSILFAFHEPLNGTRYRGPIRTLSPTNLVVPCRSRYQTACLPPEILVTQDQSAAKIRPGRASHRFDGFQVSTPVSVIAIDRRVAAAAQPKRPVM